MVREVGDIESSELVSVDTETTLISAIETMFENDYSQLGIEREGEVVGMISYRSISRVLTILRRLDIEKDLPRRTVEIAIEDLEPVIKADEDLVILFDELAENPYVIVEVPNEDPLRLITNYDLLHYLRSSIEPFLLIEDIERSIRDIFNAAFEENLDSELQEFFDEKEIRTPTSLTDCSFGHYPQFMAGNWGRFRDFFQEMDDGDFVNRLLIEIGDIRNKIFHFRTEPDNSDIDEELLTFAHSYFGKRTS